jgi:hypothetical protein
MIHTLIPSHPLETTLSEDNLSHQEHVGSKIGNKSHVM